MPSKLEMTFPGTLNNKLVVLSPSRAQEAILFASAFMFAQSFSSSGIYVAMSTKPEIAPIIALTSPAPPLIRESMMVPVLAALLSNPLRHVSS